MAYAARVLDLYLSYLPPGTRIEGARVLELGPGPYLGTALLMAAHGADVTVADPYLPTWDDQVHAPLCRAIITELSGRASGIGRLEAAIHARSLAPGVRCVAAPAEALDAIDDATVDIALSNAVFEHVEQVPRAVHHLARVTAPGGIGVHQVDFRDHHDFSRPLEYLMVDADVFWHDSARCFGERGNRWRHTQMLDAFANAGFAIERFEVSARADDGYVAGLQRRLHSDFADLSREELSVLIGCIVCRRTEATAVEPAVSVRGLVPRAVRQLLQRTTTRRIVVYGAGEGGLGVLDRLHSFGMSARTVAVCDSNPRTHGRNVGGHVVRPFDSLDPSSYDCVLIASEGGCREIAALLEAQGLIDDPEFLLLGFLGAFMHPLKAAA
jgi:SAM-dependent methyltransferase